MCILFAATYPERTSGSHPLQPGCPRGWAPDYAAPSLEEWRRQTDELVADWGTAEAEGWVRSMAASHADDPEFISEIARHGRLSASPGAIATMRRMAADVDVRDVLPAIHVPTLIANMPPAREAAYVAARIPGARRIEVPSPDHTIYFQGETLVPEFERFVAMLGAEEPDTTLATVLFTDIVGSTEKVADLGDARWRELVERHHALVRQQLSRFRGREVDTAGDGFFSATFDGPIRAIRAAHAVVESVRELGLEVRAGLHTGECEVVGDKVAGIAVNIGARIAAQAGPGEVLVSSTVKDLVAGSELQFDERGVSELKGIPGSWRLYVSPAPRRSRFLQRLSAAAFCDSIAEWAERFTRSPDWLPSCGTRTSGVSSSHGGRRSPPSGRTSSRSASSRTTPAGRWRWASPGSSACCPRRSLRPSRPRSATGSDASASSSPSHSSCCGARRLRGCVLRQRERASLIFVLAGVVGVSSTLVRPAQQALLLRLRGRPGN